MAGNEAIPVQNAGDEIVIGNQHQQFAEKPRSLGFSRKAEIFSALLIPMLGIFKMEHGARNGTADSIVGPPEM
jgi:hypothetical protein